MLLDREPVEVSGDDAALFFVRLGSELSRLRRSCELTQAQLADDLGVAVQTVSRIEAGKVKVSLARAIEIARRLGVPLSEIVAAAEGEQATEREADELRLAALWQVLTPESRELALGLLEQVREKQDR
jgi:transcriptional regulator with XRE-family HTH domain